MTAHAAGGPITPARRARPGRLLKRAAVSLLIALVMLPPLFPLYWMLISSLKGPEELATTPPTWFPGDITFGAFSEVFSVVPFGRAFLNSALIAGVSTLSVLVTSVMAGYVFAKYRFRGRDVIFWAVVATMFLPPIVTLVPLYWLVSTMGLADSYAGVMLPWLANAFGIFLMRQFIADVPDELIEAARVDGAGEMRILWKVITPLLRPALVSLALFAFVFYWNNFLWPLSILQDDGKYPVVLALSQLLSYSTSVRYQNVVMAGALIASVPTILVFLLAQRAFVQSVSRTGVKG
ncbi:ABC transporter permease [Sphaerisporangium krabiense]|uniref:Multiple sugar transport system permease protein n=1 Tax=Sphaerisporangium krabiense TaxID=763782 RepID=A0A7W8ZC46_9ACTN|nr:carbohydrate ABC transporter permease [Sphaerisporangium krabiense]MBB5631304.1 multiple sugar transport system permease protein [Sphaerisporangium krabiense]GII60721.1 ABC transporter permease [Sphaerisporangium krabiense]